MAQSFSSVPGVITFQTTLADVLTRLDFPNNTRRVRLIFSTNAGKICTTGTDGALIGAAAFWPAAADTEIAIFVDKDPAELGKGPASIFVTSATATTTVTALCESG